MKRLLFGVSLAALLTLPVQAQNLENLSGPVLTGTPPAGFSAQNFQYNCTNPIPTLGTCSPVFQIGNALTPGIQPPGASYPVAITPTQVIVDLCSLQRRTTIAISTTANLTLMLLGQASQKIYICDGFIKNSAPTNVSLIEGVGSTCATAPTGDVVGVRGVTTTSGVPLGTLGDGMPLRNVSTNIPNNSLCLIQAPASGTVLLGGYLSVVQSQL
jgi:hypothetical protein